MVTWLVDGITFITPDNSDEERLRTAAAMAKEQWSDPIDDRLLFEYEALNK